MSIDATLKAMHYTLVGGLWHLYHPYSRDTLCKVSKIHRPTSWGLQPPVCPECAATLIESELEKA
jgi:hypothetical protein